MDWENLPKQESISKKYSNWDRRGWPVPHKKLRRKLNKLVGQKWSEVYSILRNEYDHRSLVGQLIVNYINRMVEFPEFINGEYYVRGRNIKDMWMETHYVDNKGILRVAKGKKIKRRVSYFFRGKEVKTFCICRYGYRAFGYDLVEVGKTWNNRNFVYNNGWYEWELKKVHSLNRYFYWRHPESDYNKRLLSKKELKDLKDLLEGNLEER